MGIAAVGFQMYYAFPNGQLGIIFQLIKWLRVNALVWMCLEMFHNLSLTNEFFPFLLRNSQEICISLYISTFFCYNSINTSKLQCQIFLFVDILLHDANLWYRNYIKKFYYSSRYKLLDVKDWNLIYNRNTNHTKQVLKYTR